MRVRANNASGGGGGGNFDEEIWTSSTANETTQRTYDYAPLIIAAYFKNSKYYTVWYRASVSDAWTKIGNPSGYESKYITDVTGNTVTYKNVHSGSNNKYWIFVADDSIVSETSNTSLSEAITELFA